MGQKVNPHGLRVGVIKDWDSKWYAEKDFADYLVEDHKIRKFLKNKLYSAGVSKIEIERASDRVKIIVYTAKPGVVIGKGGSEIEKVKAELQKMTDKKVIVDIKEVKRPDKDAQLVDVRTPNEYSKGSLAGAVNIPAADLVSRIDTLDKNRPVILVTQNGRRAQQELKQFKSKGFSDVYVLEGGLVAWQAAKLPLTGLEINRRSNKKKKA